MRANRIPKSKTLPFMRTGSVDKQENGEKGLVASETRCWTRAPHRPVLPGHSELVPLLAGLAGAFPSTGGLRNFSPSTPLSPNFEPNGAGGHSSSWHTEIDCFMVPHLMTESARKSVAVSKIVARAVNALFGVLKEMKILTPHARRGDDGHYLRGI